jgi:hypothetical protein
MSTCMGCTLSTLDSTTLKDCSCPTNWALVEKDSVGQLLTNKTCVQCPTGSIIKTSVSLYQCQSCPNPTTQQYDASNNCVCRTGYTAVRSGIIMLFRQLLAGFTHLHIPYFVRLDLNA